MTTTTATTKRIGYLAIDIEKLGASFKYPIAAIGTCFGTGTTTGMELREFIPKLRDPIEFEPRCKTEFWDKNGNVLTHILAMGVDEPRKVFSDFNAYLTKLECEYDTVMILSDNPSFDVSHMDYYLDKYCDRLPLHYSHKGKYRPVIDWSEQAWALGTTEMVKREVFGKYGVSNTHFPKDDAKCIYLSTVVNEEYRVEAAEILSWK